MSIFDEYETLCQREGNKCRLRNKCARYLKPRTPKLWEASFYDEFGQFCQAFRSPEEEDSSG